MAAGEMGKYLRNITARYAAQGDQDLQEFRYSYSLMSSEAKAKFRTALSLICNANDIFSMLPAGVFKADVQSSWTTRDEEGMPCDEGSATLAAKLLLKALDAWDNDCEFTPPGMEFRR